MLVYCLHKLYLFSRLYSSLSLGVPIPATLPYCSQFRVIGLSQLVLPLLKKPSHEKYILCRYRPESNLTQLSNVIEKVIVLRIITHISDQRLVDCFQSANRKKKFLTETALLYVTSASKTSTDNKQGTTLIPVDFNAAFDTMKHDISISLVIHKPNVCATAPRPEGSPPT